MHSATALKLPTFAIIGAGKSGTTALFEYLGQHPDVFMPEVKETNFFALEGVEKVVSDSDDIYNMHNYPQSVTSIDEYLELFKDAKEDIRGEASPMYLYGEGVVDRIKKYAPDLKMIVILRHPVDRLYSRFMHLARENKLPTKYFSEALNRGSIWWLRNDLVKEGFYYTNLSKFYKAFNPNQIKVFLYDDLKEDPNKVMKEMFEFVGAESSFVPDQSVEYNMSGRIKNGFVNKLIGSDSVLKAFVNNVFPFLIKSLKQSKQAHKILNSLRKKNLNRQKLSSDLRKKMIDDIYKNEILKLQSLIDRDLQHWL
ncbi:MAG: sulfotransferase [Ichthyobacteriaceae bacterium]|nr:sulfotransferase [Ichthyobacteriaceae bacterium]